MAKINLLDNQSVRTKLTLIVGVALVGLVAQAGVSTAMQSSATSRTKQVQAAAQLTRTALEIDMAHDAVRAEVLLGTLAKSPDERAAAGTALAELAKGMRAKLAELVDPSVPDQARSAAAAVAPKIETYLNTADATFARTATDGLATDLSAFDQAFTVVEKELPAVGDALEAHAVEMTREVDSGSSTATRLLIFVSLLVGAVLVGFGWLISRGVLRPLADVSGVLAAMAHGDLTRHATVRGRDELGRMAGALNTAIDSVRGTVSTLTTTAGSVAASAEQTAEISRRISASADRSNTRASDAAVAADAVKDNITVSAAGNEEMGASITEISRNTQQAAPWSTRPCRWPNGPTRPWPSWATRRRRSATWSR